MVFKSQVIGFQFVPGHGIGHARTHACTFPAGIILVNTLEREKDVEDMNVTWKNTTPSR